MSIDIDLQWSATGYPERLMVTGPYKAEGIRHSAVIKRETCVATIKGTLKLKTNPALAALMGDEIVLQLNESNVGYAEVQWFMDNDKIALVPSR